MSGFAILPQDVTGNHGTYYYCAVPRTCVPEILVAPDIILFLYGGGLCVDELMWFSSLLFVCMSTDYGMHHLYDVGIYASMTHIIT